MTTYRIDDGDGNEISCGWESEDEARKAAQRWANQCGRAAFVSEEGSDADPEQFDPQE